MKFNLFDSVRVKLTGDIGFISSIINTDSYAINTGYDDNQPVCSADDLELSDG